VTDFPFLPENQPNGILRETQGRHTEWRELAGQAMFSGQMDGENFDENSMKGVRSAPAR
jgi:hypothetical protein